MKVEVVVDTGSFGLVEALTYLAPDSLVDKIEIGACVVVPLGSRQIVGYIVAKNVESSIEDLREIVSIVDTPIKLNQDLIELAKWVSDQYICPLSKTIFSILPGVVQSSVKYKISRTVDWNTENLSPAELQFVDAIGLRNDEIDLDEINSRFDKSKVSKFIRQLEIKGFIKRSWELVPPEGRARSLKAVEIKQTDIDDSKLTDKQKTAFDLVLTKGRPMAVAELVNRFSISSSSINSLLKRGIFAETAVTFRRVPRFSKIPSGNYELSQQQSEALDEVVSAIESEFFKGILLHGVTASGKTEVYIRAIEKTLEMGKTALMLLPEIALTTQVMDIFRSRLGEQVAVLHSSLSAGERYDEWCRIRTGQARVVLGARSSVFAPLKDIGLIVVDEEHEPSYKQDNPPRYHCRDVAMQRARAAGCALVLGSATPAVESYFKAQIGELQLLEMPTRVADRPMPKIIVANMRREYAKGSWSIFSDQLMERIIDRLNKKQQVILFQNRRAYSTFLLCRDCGHVLKCPHCEVSLKLHSAAAKLSCHHCDFQQSAPDFCPKCQSRKIGKFGIGTEKVEEETSKAFPNARVIRMDRDTTSRKGAHADILSAFRRGDADILVGTQMIAKGLDFPRVTLVGVISADTSLNMPDFRAPERTFQMLSQVSGRSGRGIECGEVVIQTFDPEHYAVAYAAKNDYIGFYNEELQYRKELNYPPYSLQINLLTQDAVDSDAKNRATQLHRVLVKEISQNGYDIVVSDPLQSPISKLRGQFRWHIVCRCVDKGAVQMVVKAVIAADPKLMRKVIVDVDPMSML